MFPKPPFSTPPFPKPPFAPDVPLLPQDDTEPNTRAEGLELRQDVYRHVWDWPANVATSSYLHDDDGYGASYIRAAVPVYGKIGTNYAALGARTGPKAASDAIGDAQNTDPRLLTHTLLTSFRSQARANTSSARPKTWQAYSDLFQTIETPQVVRHINDARRMDRAIAWQRVAGCNPMVLTRCDRVPEAFPVTEEIYQSVMDDRDSLEAAIAEHRLYIADYAILDGVPCGVTEGQQKYLAAPFALYAVDRASGQLRSVCIQPGQSPDTYPIFTPKDGWRWRMANQCVQVADANHHEGVAHLGQTHLVMEAVTLSMKRQLAENHPLAVLLEPHTETTLAINASAKTSLIAPGGTVDVTFAAKISAFGGLVHKAVASLSIRNANPRADLTARGLMDTTALPNHPYREDAIPVWDAIELFVGDYIRVYYRTAADVENDTELAAFAAELASDTGGRLTDVPQPKSIDALIHLMTTLVFRASAQHSAVNFPQYPYMGYVPNMAGALYTAPPTSATENSEAAYLAMLPPFKVATESVTMVYLLSEVRSSTLGKYGTKAFRDPRLVPVLLKHKKRLADLDKTIAARDALRFLPYPFLRPSQILQSISI